MRKNWEITQPCQHWGSDFCKDNIAKTETHSLPAVKKLVRGLGLTIVYRSNQLLEAWAHWYLQKGFWWEEHYLMVQLETVYASRWSPRLNNKNGDL